MVYSNYSVAHAFVYVWMNLVLEIQKLCGYQQATSVLLSNGNSSNYEAIRVSQLNLNISFITKI